MKPTQEVLMRLFDYDAEAGFLIWKQRKLGIASKLGGTKAGHLRNDGYIHVKVCGRSYYAHCIIWCMVTGEWPKSEVDHADLNRSNNIWTNLRLATSSQNSFARRAKSKTRGVHLLSSGRYRAVIGKDGRDIHLGYFSSFEEAQAVRRAKAKELFGEFA